jgi:hypothetical protein
VTQPSPADWLEVEYERSDWVEERLVDVIRTGVEIVAQDVSDPGSYFYLGEKGTPADQQYVATRMGLKAKPNTSARFDQESEAEPVTAITNVKEDKKD